MKQEKTRITAMKTAEAYIELAKEELVKAKPPTKPRASVVLKAINF